MNKHLDVPLTSKINEETGVRDFINDMDNQLIYIDKVSLEDLIAFHDAQFEIIDGYDYNDDRNEHINYVIEYSYNLRLKLRKDENPAEMVIKLLMNSMYGNTIIKSTDTYTVVKYIQN